MTAPTTILFQADQHLENTPNGLCIHSLKETPTAEQLKNFERDPVIALLAIATNSGLDRFNSANNLNDPRITDGVKEDLIKVLKEEIEIQ